MNRLIQLAFEQCVPTTTTDLTFCFNYTEPKKLRLKSIQYYKDSTTSSSLNRSKNTTRSRNSSLVKQDEKKFKIDVSQSSSKYDKLKYSKVTIRIGSKNSNTSGSSSRSRSFNHKQDQHFIKHKQVNKLNSNLKVIIIIR